MFSLSDNNCVFVLLPFISLSASLITIKCGFIALLLFTERPGQFEKDDLFDLSRCSEYLLWIIYTNGICGLKNNLTTKKIN